MNEIGTFVRNPLALAGFLVLLGAFAFILLRKPAPPFSATIGSCRVGEACPGGAQLSSVPTIESNELVAALEVKDFFFVNVHTPYQGEIGKTDAFIRYDEIGDNLDKLPQDKSVKIVLYCQSGRMSEIAAKKLASLGYTNVSHLKGGMVEWEKEGYELIREGSAR
ncbi:MAG: rhodanese-like domain-containing protein [Candidatus Kaiserbacteria bacterium]|nr:MAG: rhodanese-like domain-containing protein [Candidatus Kaiserbacteria bacterium]